MTRPINILYADDYPLDRELVRDALEEEALKEQHSTLRSIIDSVDGGHINAVNDAAPGAWSISLPMP